MFNISIYLDKFKDLDLKSSSLKKIITDSISKFVKINIDKNNIKIKNKIIYLNVNPVVKNELFINKISIINDLKTKNIIIKSIL